MAVQATTNLPLVLCNKKYKQEVYAEFVVVDIPVVHNVIFRWSVLDCHRIIINMDYLCLKLPVPGGITIGNQKSPQECYRHSMRESG